jgi:Secretion system C-terminal sorting domain
VEQTNNAPFFFFSATVTAPTLNVTGLLASKSYKFKVRAICANGKSDWSGWFTFAMPQNIQNKPATTTTALHVAVWPNPISDGLLQINVEGATQEPIHLRFVDAYGKMVTIQKQETVEDWALSLPLPAGLPEGVYYLQVVQAGKVKTITVLVKR